jgi:hypothetical protein
MALLSFEQVRDGLLTDPSVYPHQVDFGRQAVLFVQLSREIYAAASFLDDRLLSPQMRGRWTPFAQLDPLLGDAVAARPVHFIFHAGHVGSTLISRMLDQAGGVLGLREPLPLRTLAEAFDTIGAADALADPERVRALLRWQLAWWGRGYPDTRAVVVKATSSAGRMAPALLHTQPGARAIYLSLAAEPYLATLLAGENSPLDLRGHGPERMRRLERMAGSAPTPLYAMSLGQIAAMTWTVERLTQARAQSELGERVLPIDFDAFLRAPGETLRRICGHFDVAALDSFFAEASESAVLRRYSKAPEHPYTPDLREEILAQSRVQNAVEIGKGLAWLEQFKRAAPELAGALSA